MNYKYLEKDKRKKILILSDDLRTHSGIGTMTKEIVRQTCHRYNYVQLGAAINHPEKGKKASVAEDFEKETGYKDLSIDIYASDGYGNPDILRQLILQENPDAIMIYTDPRYWEWLFRIEYEIRRKIPIFYYNIWDDTPPPYYNKSYYKSCDLLMNISRQTHALVKEVLSGNCFDLSTNKDQEPFKEHNTIVSYVPHGINTKIYKPLTDKEIKQSKVYELLNNMLDLKKDDMVFFANNRNIRRKKLSDVIWSFNEFSKAHNHNPKYKLIIHTDPIDKNGTDLIAVKKTLAPDAHIYFSSKKLNEVELNVLYNIVDVTINIACAEGFGLTTAESLATETPIVVNVTGGLQDQCGFMKDDGTLLTINDYDKYFLTNADCIYSLHGEWVFPIFPSVRTMVGSIPTPYIYESLIANEDLIDIFEDISTYTKAELKYKGKLGREFILREDIGMSAKEMGNGFIRSMDYTLDKFQPRTKYEIELV